MKMQADSSNEFTHCPHQIVTGQRVHVETTWLLSSRDPFLHNLLSYPDPTFAGLFNQMLGATVIVEGTDPVVEYVWPFRFAKNLCLLIQIQHCCSAWAGWQKRGELDPSEIQNMLAQRQNVFAIGGTQC